MKVCEPAAWTSVTTMGVEPEQAAKRTRDGGGDVDTIAYLLSAADPAARAGNNADGTLSIFGTVLETAAQIGVPAAEPLLRA